MKLYYTPSPDGVEYELDPDGGVQISPLHLEMEAVGLKRKGNKKKEIKDKKMEEERGKGGDLFLSVVKEDS